MVIMRHASISRNCESREELFTVTARSTSHSYTWTIDDFAANSEEEEHYETHFEIPNVNGIWALEFRPPSETDFGSLLLKLTELFSPTSVYLQLHAYILSAHDKIECNTRLKWPDRKFYMLGSGPTASMGLEFHVSMPTQSHGYQEFVSLEDLTNKSLIHNNTLTIVYDIQVFHGIGLEVLDTTARQNAMTSINCQLFSKLNEQHGPRVADDLKAVYKDSHGTDTIIRAGGKEFRVHSVLLVARSSVFRAMFDHDTKEKTDRRIEIDDLIPDVVESMLHFMYTDEVLNIDTLAEELLVAADKYDIARLKGECQRYLTAVLDVHNATAMLILADTHNANELQSASVKFITRNLRAVRQTEGWKSLSPESKEKVFDELPDVKEHNMLGPMY